MDRAREILQLCDGRGWIVIAGIEPDETVNEEELEEALRQEDAVQTRDRWCPSPDHPAPPPTSPCPCGSGRRYRKCCMRR
ncbi:MAG: SEC-C domain-containing protein [Candidatus Riflebacteria bacterium]|nr:SEC-C domain-containing protein [Candidatus Riflebacteria bacterium]